MPILDKNNIREVNKYKRFLKEKNASFMQSLNWGKIKNNWIQEVIYLEEKNKIIVSMSILLYKIPMFNSYMMYCPRGPVCDINDLETINKLIQEVKVIQNQYKGFVLKFDPEVKYDEKIVKLFKNNKFKINKSDNVIQPRYNMILDINNKTIDELMLKFGEKTRYNIKLSMKKGINVRYSNLEKDLKVFYELYKITCKRDKIGCRSYEYFKLMLDNFDETEIRVYVASHETEDLSAAIALNYGGKMFYIYGASSNVKRNLMPNYLMQYEMIKWGIERKCNNYDFGGVFEFTNENGLFKFKSGFCKEEGVTEFIGEIDKVYNPFIYFCYNNVLPFVKKIKKVLSRFKI
jgi:serine/alanine adding enzyme